MLLTDIRFGMLLLWRRRIDAERGERSGSPVMDEDDYYAAGDGTDDGEVDDGR